MWVRDAEPAPPPANEDERSELKRLRKEVRQLRMERDILKKAAAFFAKHSS
jgi:transposase